MNGMWTRLRGAESRVYVSVHKNRYIDTCVPCVRAPLTSPHRSRLNQVRRRTGPFRVEGTGTSAPGASIENLRLLYEELKFQIPQHCPRY